MSMSTQTRRELLRRMTALSTVGAAASTFGIQLATMGAAAADTSTSGYRALVCIFMLGGNDAHNMVLATDPDSWGRYTSARNSGSSPIALMPVGASPSGGFTTPSGWGGVLPIPTSTPNPVPPGTNASSRTFAIHPAMAPLLPVWQAGRLGVMANVGPLIQPTTRDQYRNKLVKLPANLMSHNDQQATWQSGAGEGAIAGWGGLMADQILSLNGANGSFTAISTTGNAVFLAGKSVTQYQISTNQKSPAISINAAANPGASFFGASGAGQRARDIIRDANVASYFGRDYNAKVVRSMDTADLLNATFAASAISGIAGPTPVLNPITRANETNGLAIALQSIAKVIAANATLGMKRQVFFVGMGGFDTHNNENASHAPLMARLAHALAYFDATLGNLGGVDMRKQVTTFTASDFARGITTNGDGTDHAWGSHHFVMGGSVRGGMVHGQFPTIGIDQGGFVNPDMQNGALIPTTSVDQYAATMGKWFGMSDSQLDAIFPNLKNFTKRDVGFLNAPVA
jgi:uncharacterized protein (DUF1501 family)